MEASARAGLIAQGKQLKEQLSHLESCLDDTEAELQREAQKIPNLTHPQVCAGDSACQPDCMEVQEHGRSL